MVQLQLRQHSHYATDGNIYVLRDAYTLTQQLSLSHTHTRARAHEHELNDLNL